MARTRYQRRTAAAAAAAAGAAQANPQANPLQLLSQIGAKKQAKGAKKQPRAANRRGQGSSRSAPTHSGGSGVKRMRLSRRQTAKWKIKRLSPPPRNISVKKNGREVRKMIVRRNAIYPHEAGGNY